MAHKFHKLSTQSAFPNIDNVQVYKYDNDFDYSRYDYTQMDLQICTVPWDMGEAHVGNRTISGIGNVVYFGSKESRDAWFDSIPDSECFRFSTKFKELHREQMIDVPIPYDVCAKHNYLKVHYSLFANDESPVMYEDADGLRDWFWFIREVEFIAPNTTRLHILDDAFQTWIYDVDVSGMVLERGHAPMFSMRASEYLANPIDNNTNLLTEDVNFGTISQVKSVDVLELNSGTMYACIATTGNPTLNWGSKSDGTWRTAASRSYTVNGNPSVYVFAVAVNKLSDLLNEVTTNYPQFKQTVQGVFFASSDLLTLGTAFTFATVTCYPVSSTRKSFDFVSLAKSDFGYDSKYADLAKLYTSPYAHIEVTDENGNVDVIKVEDTDGTLTVSAALSLSYPFITLDAHVNGAGGTVSRNVTYKNITSHTFDVKGRWYDTLRTWKVPTFAVVLDASREYDYSTYFDRAQRVVDYTTAYNDTSETATATKSDRDASADTGKANADASADAAETNVATMAAANKANADANADTLVANSALSQAANTATTNRSNTSANTDSSNAQTYNTGVATADNILVGASATSTIAANQQQGNISAAAGIANGVVGAAGSAVSGDALGAASSIPGAIIGAVSTIASTAVANGLTAAQAGFTQASNSAHATAANTKTEWDTDNQTDTATDIAVIQNTLMDGTSDNTAATTKANATRTQSADNTAAANTATTEKANATRTQTTEKANALRDYNATMANAARDRSQAQSAITNDTAQAALRAPFVYGSFSDGESSANKPIALFANVVTQSKGAIAAAGDEFLRYGYMLDRYFEFDGNWNVGKYFTYWKLRDFWVTNLNVPDMYMDRLRFFLFGGVTIWKRPEDIGKRTIYENFT